MRRIFKILLALIAAAVLLGGAVAGSAYPLLRRVQSNVHEAQAKAIQAEQMLKEERDFSSASTSLKEAADLFARVLEDLERLNYLRLIPWVSRNLKASQAGILAAEVAARALASAADAVGTIYEPFRDSAEVRIGDLPIEKRAELLKNISDSIPTLHRAKDDLGAVRLLLTSAMRADLFTPLQEELSRFQEAAKTAEGLLSDGIPLLEVAPSLLGFPEPKTYLFVLQNSDEMRPTGGFMGTYGFLTLEAGHIVEFSTDDIYNLDRLVPVKERPPAPEAIEAYLEQPHFYLRDANWDPDFRSSAASILQFYEEEAAFIPREHPLYLSIPRFASDFDGVMAIMPEAIRPLLTMVGPIDVQGQTFTAENLTDALEYEVEIGFEQRGILRPQRKAIISELGHQLIAKLLALPIAKWPDVLHSVRVALDERHILIYANDRGLQGRLELHGWTGSVAPAPFDYLAVFDANLFALKTDPYVFRNIFYKVYRRGQALIGEVEIAYAYPQSGPAWKTKGYRSFTRVYVPKGSILISAFGAMAKEESREPGQVAITQEFGKTVFGAFIAVQSGETKRLKFIYRLPDEVSAALQDGVYELFIQKQPGTIGHGLTVSADFGKVPADWSPTGLNVTREGARLTWQTSLRRDQMFRIEF